MQLRWHRLRVRCLRIPAELGHPEVDALLRDVLRVQDLVQPRGRVQHLAQRRASRRSQTSPTFRALCVGPPFVYGWVLQASKWILLVQTEWYGFVLRDAEDRAREPWEAPGLSSYGPTAPCRPR